MKSKPYSRKVYNALVTIINAFWTEGERKSELVDLLIVIASEYDGKWERFDEI